jgi:hypothetical protein
MHIYRVYSASAGTGIGRHGVYFNNGLSDWIPEALYNSLKNCGVKIIKDLSIPDAIIDTLLICAAREGICPDRIIQLGIQAILDTKHIDIGSDGDADTPVVADVKAPRKSARIQRAHGADCAD